MPEIPDFPAFPQSASNGALIEMTRIVFGEQRTTEPCDCIFVFGGIDQGLWETALEAYEQRLSGRILITGGVKTQGLDPRTPSDQPESEIMRSQLMRCGVPSSAIEVETRSSNTYENVRYALETFDFGSVRSILAVGTSRGVGRQTRTLQQALPDVEIYSYSFHSKIRQRDGLLTPDNWQLDETSRSYVWGQLLRIFEYGNRRHLEPLSDLSDELYRLIESAISELS